MLSDVMVGKKTRTMVEHDQEKGAIDAPPPLSLALSLSSDTFSVAVNSRARVDNLTILTSQATRDSPFNHLR